MIQDDRLNVRVPKALVRRLRDLIPKAARLPEAAMVGKMTLSKVAYLALTRGADVLEAETEKTKADRSR